MLALLRPRGGGAACGHVIGLPRPPLCSGACAGVGEGRPACVQAANVLATVGSDAGPGGGGAEGRREIDGELDGKYGGTLSVHRCMCIHMCTCTSMHTYIYISIDTQRNKEIDNHKKQEKNLRKQPLHEKSKVKKGIFHPVFGSAG